MAQGSKYWIGNSGNWSDSEHWSLTSGGPGTTFIPTATADVWFDANSFTTPNATVTVNTSPISFSNFQVVGLTNNATLDWGTAEFSTVFGTVYTFSTAMAMIGSATTTSFNIQGTPGPALTGTSITLTTNSAVLPGNMILNRNLFGGGQPTLYFNGSVVLDGSISCLAGHLETRGQNIETRSVLISGGSNINFATSTILFNRYGTFAGFVGGYLPVDNLGINTSSATMIFDMNTSDSKRLRNAIATTMIIGTVIIRGTATGTTFIRFEENNFSQDSDEIRINNFLIQEPPRQVSFGSFNTADDHNGTVICNYFEAIGTAGSIITLRTVDDRILTLESASAIVSYVDVRNNTAGGAGIPFDNTNGGIDSGNNTNWLFPATAAAGVTWVMII